MTRSSLIYRHNEGLADDGGENSARIGGDVVCAQGGWTTAALVLCG